MRLPKSSLFRTALIVVVSVSLTLSLSFSLRLAGVSANPVNPIKPSPTAPPRQVLSHSLAMAKTFYLKFLALFQGGANLATMRNNSPQAFSYSAVGSLPAAGYDDPKPTNTTNYNSYLTRLSARDNAVGAGQPTTKKLTALPFPQW